MFLLYSIIAYCVAACRPPKGWCVGLWILVVIGLAGCARWDRTDATSHEMVFPQRRLPADSAALEIGIVQLDDSQTESFETFWDLLDRQKLPIATRQRLDQNGLRVAVMASHAPAELHELQSPRPVELQDLDVVEQQMVAKNMLKPEPRLILHQRLSNRSGESHPIEISPVHPQFSWIVRQGDRQSVGTGKYVRGLIDMVSIPQGDGSVRLRLTPEIHHGENRPTINVAERSFVLDSSQTVQKLDDLLVAVELRPGETLVLAPTADVSDLGRLFFGQTEAATATGSRNDLAASSDSHLTHRILMIRVVQTQMDDLFGNSTAGKKLSTTSRR